MSNDIQRLIRKLQPTGPRSFDEQTWPIYIAAIVLCGYLCGMVLAFLNFNDPRWHANALTWLILVVVGGVVGMWSISLLRNSILKRTLVLSFLLSLIINLSLLIVMAATWIFANPWNDTEPKTVVENREQEVVVPEYPIFNELQQQRVPQEHEKPVETGEPEAEKRIELTRQSTSESEQLVDPEVPTSSATSGEELTVKPERAETPSAPRQNEQLARLSRQPLRAEPKVNRRPAVRTNSRAASASERTPAASPAATQRLASQNLPEMKREVAPDQERVSPPQLSRRADTESPRVAALSSLTRRLREPARIPKTTTPVESASTTAERSKESLEPASTLTTKRTTSAPEQSVRADLQPKVAVNLDRRNELNKPATETLSPSPARSSLARSASRAKLSSRVDSPDTQPENASSSRLAEATPSESTLARDATSPSAAKSPSVENQETQPQVVASARAVTRATERSRDTNPKVTASAMSRSARTPDAKSPIRPNRIARVTASSKADVSSAMEAMAESENANPVSQPSRVALSRSSIGVAGVGNASNLERGAAAPDVPVTIASASANRARSTQDMEPGPALAPSKPSMTRRMRANKETPRTSMQAQPIDTAMVAGTNAPAAEASSSAATLQRAASNAPAASTTAAKGTTEVDLGPTRIAADTGSGRAEGGGQPEIVTGEVPRTLARENNLAGSQRVKTNTEAANATAPAVGMDAEPNAAPELASSSSSETGLARSSTSSAASVNGPADSALTGSGINDPSASEAINVSRASPGRAELDESGGGQPALAVGGTNTARKQSSRSLQIQTDAESNLPALASLDASDGDSRGEPLDAQGARPQRAASGALVDNAGESGAAAADSVVDGLPEGLSAPSFDRSESGSGDGQSVALSPDSRGARKRGRRVAVTGASTDVELDPEEFAMNLPGGEFGDDSLAPGTGVGGTELTRQSSDGGLLVEVDAEVGEGGLGDTPAVDTGIFARNANEDSELVSLEPARFVGRAQTNAAVATKTEVVTPARAFRRRIIRKGKELAGERGFPTPKTEAAIELGLVFLSRFQSADGSWSFGNFADGKAEIPVEEDPVMVSDTAATGLSLLSFLGAGYHHRADKYQERVKAGLAFLVQHQREDGDLYIDQEANSSRSGWLYSHAIATLALCEAYGMTQDPELRQPAQKALNFIIESQHPTRGGWRYSPAYGSDTSVSGWMTMALKSGELAGLNVPEGTFRSIRRWLDLARASESQPYLFRYNPFAADNEEQNHQLKPTRTITAVGLLMRLYTGWRRDDVNMILGARVLSRNPPELGSTSRPRRNTYYWYYATQVMFHMGGEYWSNWNASLHPMLARSQIKDGALSGSWNPLTPVPDRWGAYGGRLYVTTMNLLSLEVFYRHMPLYEDTSK